MDTAFLRLNCVIEGVQRTETVVGTLEQACGDLLLVAPSDLHASRNGSEGPMAYWCLHFDCDDAALRRMLCSAGTTVFRADSRVVGAVRPVAEKLVAAALQPTNGGVGGKLGSLMLLCEMLSALAGAYQESFGGGLPATGRAASTDRGAGASDRGPDRDAGSRGIHRCADPAFGL